MISSVHSGLASAAIVESRKPIGIQANLKPRTSSSMRSGASGRSARDYREVTSMSAEPNGKEKATVTYPKHTVARVLLQFQQHTNTATSLNSHEESFQQEKFLKVSVLETAT